MISLFLYSILAVALLVAIAALLRKPGKHHVDEIVEKRVYTTGDRGNHWLRLSERIFDPADARWLQDELAFPKLAAALTLDRKELAIRWLEALQLSFDEFVRTPAVFANEDSSQINDWEMLGLALRFKFLISYALIVVKVLGPYHSLIPSFKWVPLLGRAQKGRKEAFAGTSTSR
jgi:hypothetical protein